MALDGLSLGNMGVIRDILPGELQLQLKEANAVQQAVKKIEHAEGDKLDPDKRKNKEEQKKQQQENAQKKLYKNIFDEIPEERKSDIQDLDQVINRTENKREYKVVYNSYNEIIEIIHIKSNQVTETLTLEELKSFIMKVKNPLGIIVDRKI